MSSRAQRGIAFTVLLLLATPALAHGGGLDKNGCHRDGDSGGYHCHDPTPGEMHGRVRVVDGDTIDMGRTRIRLYGIDAVEGDQSCTRPDKKRWECGRQARVELARFIAREPVTCRKRGKDKYGRTLAVCWTAAGEINDWLVRQGWAVAYTKYSPEYADAQAEAKAAQRNIWSGTFTYPERYRHRKQD